MSKKLCLFILYLLLSLFTLKFDNSNSKLATNKCHLFFFFVMCNNFCSATECGDIAPVSTMVISGDEEGPSSSEEDVLVDYEKELPRSCGFTDKFKVRNGDLIYLFIWVQEFLVGGVAVGRELGEQELDKVLL